MTGFHLCVGCDALRDTERAFCASCGEATDSYLYEPSEREEFELLALANSGRIVGSVPRVSFTETLGDPMRGIA